LNVNISSFKQFAVSDDKLRSIGNDQEFTIFRVRQFDLKDNLSSCKKDKKNTISLHDGAKIGVIGGGPAGSFFSFFAFNLAKRMGLTIGIDIYPILFISKSELPLLTTFHPNIPLHPYFGVPARWALR